MPNGWSLFWKSKPNYTANSKKGAVDLSWTQPDGKNKTYKLYQSMDGSTWKQISSASEVGSTVSAVKSFSFQNKAQTYTVPYTGEYEITLNGAQGGKYGQYTGGLGGRTTARVWLEKGETLSFRVGGQSGYPDGGKGTSYGNGGGSTSVFTARLGTFLYAGGGGGASAVGNGGAGGSSASVGSSAKGADGMAGGGGGYRGGSSGESDRAQPYCRLLPHGGLKLHRHAKFQRCLGLASVCQLRNHWASDRKLQ